MNFLRGAAILTFAGIGVKVLGGVNRILLSRLLGGEGIGIYQMAYPVYLLFAALAGAGFPIAVSILVSEKLAKGDGNAVQDLWPALIKMLAALGLVMSVLVYFLAEHLITTGLISDARAYWGIMALLPAIFFSLVLGGMRGYFQGHQLMHPTAVSQILEQFFRVVSMLVMAYFLLPYGLTYAAAGAAGGASIGALFGILALLPFRSKVLKKLGTGTKSTFDFSLIARFFRLAIPVSLAGLVIPLTALLDMFFVPRCLMLGGLGQVESTIHFGYLAGMAQPLILLSIIPVSSIVFSMVPALTGLGGSDRIKQSEILYSAWKWVLLITVPAGLGMSVLGGPLAIFLYAAPGAGDAMIHSGISIILLGLLLLSGGALMGLAKTNVPVLNLLIGAGVKVGCLWFFAREIIGCAWATNAHYALTALLNIVVLTICGYRFPYMLFGKIILAGMVMGGLVYGCFDVLQPLMGNNFATLLAVVAGAIIYCGTIFTLKVVTWHELCYNKRKGDEKK